VDEDERVPILLCVIVFSEKKNYKIKSVVLPSWWWVDKKKKNT